MTVCGFCCLNEAETYVYSDGGLTATCQACADSYCLRSSVWDIKLAHAKWVCLDPSRISILINERILKLIPGLRVCSQCTQRSVFPNVNPPENVDWLSGGRAMPLEDVCSACRNGSGVYVYRGRDSIPGEGRTIGIEYELEPTKGAMDRLARWVDENGSHMVSGKVDGSLRGQRPAEFASPILYESNFADWVKEFTSRLKYNVYSRCGLHIHIGSECFSWKDINNIAYYCKLWEKEICGYVSPSRTPAPQHRNSGRPMMLPASFRNDFPTEEALLNYFYGSFDFYNTARRNRRVNERANCNVPGFLHRYQWLNLHAHFFKGALEIRLHQGTGNESKVICWIMFWLYLLPFAAKKKNRDLHPLQAVPKRLKTFYEKRKVDLLKVRATHVPIMDDTLCEQHYRNHVKSVWEREGYHDELMLKAQLTGDTKTISKAMGREEEEPEVAPETPVQERGTDAARNEVTFNPHPMGMFTVPSGAGTTERIS